LDYADGEGGKLRVGVRGGGVGGGGVLEAGSGVVEQVVTRETMKIWHSVPMIKIDKEYSIPYVSTLCTCTCTCTYSQVRSVNILLCPL
jgi:hypothetical protein